VRGIPANKRDLTARLYATAATTAQILAAVNQLPGKIVTWGQVKSFARRSGLARTAQRKRGANVWSAERDDVLARRYADAPNPDAVRAIINALPGPKVTHAAMKVRARRIGAARAARLHLPIARAIGVSNRDALDALAWARKRGIPIDGKPFAVAARIAAAVQVAA